MPKLLAILARKAMISHDFEVLLQTVPDGKIPSTDNYNYPFAIFCKQRLSLFVDI